MAEMREILFRGFYECENGKEKIFINGKKITGVWVYGGTWKNARGQRFITEDNGCKTFAVIPETVGQYTGLQDENGARIFEGDILKEIECIHDGEVQIVGDYLVVRFINGCFLAVDKPTKWYFVENLESKVVGNIHDNPELLTTK